MRNLFLNAVRAKIIANLGIGDALVAGADAAADLSVQKALKGTERATNQVSKFFARHFVASAVVDDHAASLVGRLDIDSFHSSSEM